VGGGCSSASTTPRGGSWKAFPTTPIPRLGHLAGGRLDGRLLGRRAVARLPGHRLATLRRAGRTLVQGAAPSRGIRHGLAELPLLLRGCAGRHPARRPGGGSHRAGGRTRADRPVQPAGLGAAARGWDVGAWWGADSDRRCRSCLGVVGWASEKTTDPAYRELAARHARRHIELCVREDGSVSQTATFDPRTGEVARRYSHQGYSDESTWARAQA
jgi:hypothetical protein